MYVHMLVCMYIKLRNIQVFKMMWLSVPTRGREIGGWINNAINNIV